MANEEMDIASVIGKLMNDPSTSDMVRMLKKLLEGTQSESEAEPEHLSVTEGSSQPQTASADLEKMSEVISALSPLTDSVKKAGGGEIEQRNRLLAALKPYLNSNRQDMIEKIMSLSRLTGIMDILPKR